MNYCDRKGSDGGSTPMTVAAPTPARYQVVLVGPGTAWLQRYPAGSLSEVVALALLRQQLKVVSVDRLESV